MEDLSVLGASLNAGAGMDVERPWSTPRTGGATSGSNKANQDLVEDVLRRHAKSPQPESKRICKMLQVILDSLEHENIEPKPVALFAALVLALEGTTKSKDSAVVVLDQSALLYLLEEAANVMPPSAVRLKFSRSVKVVCAVLEARLKDEKPNTQVLKFGVGSLSNLLCGLEPNNFPSAAAPFTLLLKFVMHGRPKVRKRAYAGLAKVILAMQDTSALQLASRTVANLVKQTIQGLVEITAAYETQSKSKKDDQALQSATTMTFHVLGGLKEIMAYLDPEEALAVVEALDKLMEFKEVLLAHHSSLVLDRFFQSPHITSSMKPQVLMTLLKNLVERMLIIEELMVDADIASSTMNMLFSGFRALRQMDNDLCLQCIPQLFHHCLHYFRRKDSEAFRIKVSSVLSDLMELCITEEAVGKAFKYSQNSSNKEHPVLSIVAGVEAMLTVPYQDSWNNAFQLISKLALIVGEKYSDLMKSILQELGLLAAGPENDWTDAIQECIGNVVRALGPAVVLDAIPLEIENAVEKGAEANSWLVFILKKNTYGASLEFWAKHLLPLARKVGDYAMKLSESNDIERAVLLRALEHQIWQTLPAFCRWSSDTSTGFKFLAKSLGLALQNREDLRNYICNAIACIVKQNTSIIREAKGSANFFDAQSVSEDGVFDFDESFPIPEFYDEDFAKANIEAVALYAKNFLPLLFNMFVSSKPSDRGQIHAAISAFGMITDPETLDGFYKNILKRMSSSLQSIQAENEKSMKDASLEQQAMLMDIAAALVPGLKKSALESLLNITNVSIVYKDSNIQKKSYKLLFCLLKRPEEFSKKSLSGIQESMVKAQGACYPPAKKNRLLCLRAMIAIIDSRAEDKEKDQDLMTSMVAEIVMCTKEKNSKTHKAALDLLADIASSFKGLESVSEGPLLEAGPLGFINVVAGGLVASHPHMISATIVALTRLVYQFSDVVGVDVMTDVEQAVSSLLKTKSREVVKSVLGFLNMYVTTLDGASLHARLPQVIESLLIWANDTKNRFRLKIRYILEKIIRILGMDEVTKYIPEEHLPLIRYIRKQKSKEKRKRDGSTAGYSVRTRDTTGKGTTWTYMDEEEDDDGMTMSKFGAKSATTMRGNGAHKRAMTTTTRVKRARTERGMGSLNDLSMNEPTNLLDSKHMVNMNARSMPGRRDSDDEMEFKTSKDGKMIIKNDRYEKRDHDSEDEDMDDRATVKSKSTMRSRAKSKASTHMTGHTAKSRASQRSSKSSKSKIIGGEKFKSKKGAGGDVKGTSKLEPFAYWPFDRKMLNRRAAKRKAAKKELLHVVKSKSTKKSRQQR